MQKYAREFYNSTVWRKLSKLYARSVFFLCEKCGREGKIVHHIKHITSQNINDENITLNTNNLMYLCIECHNRIHGRADSKLMIWDKEGNLVDVMVKHTPHQASKHAD